MAALDKVFANSPIKTRIHVRIRALSCPFRRIDKLLPREGKFLDFGGGNGALACYLALRAPKRQFLILDHDKNKMDFVKSLSQIKYKFADVRKIRPEDMLGFSDVLIVDMLYLLPEVDRNALFTTIRKAFENVNARLWIKEVVDGKGLKSSWNIVQEYLAMHLGITKSSGSCRAIRADVLQNELRQAGFSSKFHLIDSGYPHAHAFFFATPL